MSAAMMIGMADTIINGHRGLQAAGLIGTFATAAILASPAAAILGCLGTLAVSRLANYGRSENENVYEMLIGKPVEAEARHNAPPPAPPTL